MHGARRNLVSPLAHLARVEVVAGEVVRLEKNIEEVLAYVAQVENVQATARPLTTTISGVAQVLREDAVTPSPLADALLAQVPERRKRLVRVPVIL